MYDDYIMLALASLLLLQSTGPEKMFSNYSFYSIFDEFGPMYFIER
jgi:hypothetical protein